MPAAAPLAAGGAARLARLPGTEDPGPAARLLPPVTGTPGITPAPHISLAEPQPVHATSSTVGPGPYSYPPSLGAAPQHYPRHLAADRHPTRPALRHADPASMKPGVAQGSHDLLHSPRLAPPLPGFMPTSAAAATSAGVPTGAPAPTTGSPLARRPSMVRFYSTPTLPCMSPTRQQFRLSNATPRPIKETVVSSQRVDETGKTVNQYLVNSQIGCGTFGTVWKVTDTSTSEPYAMKEYSKSSLRKHLRAEHLSQRRAAMRKRGSTPVRGNTPTPPQQQQHQLQLQHQLDVDCSAFSLIRREFAIAKKLDHPNIVTLVEVLDDPKSDSLYLILEWCENGPVMSSSKHKTEALDHLPPLVDTACLTEEQCRLYFRDMILGIEYLHSQGVIHRDIKADNLLLDEDDVLKIADFGVSELFEQDNDVITKTAGSPAYMAPELAIISNGTLMPLAATRDISISSMSGRSADIWSMGVTLYYMLFGILPFRADNVMDLYTKIVTEEVEFPREDINPDLKDLFARVLCKSPQKRIKMDALREHPWVTHRNEDALVSKEENISDSVITPVTEEDILSAIERVRGLGVEPEQAMAKLRRLHGWRGQPSSSRSSSRSPSVSPYLGPHSESSAGAVGAALARVPSPLPMEDVAHNNISVHKLTRALEEVVRRNHSKTRSVSGTSTGAGAGAGTGPGLYYKTSSSSLFYQSSNSSASSIDEQLASSSQPPRAPRAPAPQQALNISHALAAAAAASAAAAPAATSTITPGAAIPTTAAAAAAGSAPHPAAAALYNHEIVATITL